MLIEVNFEYRKWNLNEIGLFKSLMILENDEFILFIYFVSLNQGMSNPDLFLSEPR